MTSPTPMNANEFIERQLDERANALEKVFDSHLIAFIGPIVFGVDDAIRYVVEKRR